MGFVDIGYAEPGTDVIVQIRKNLVKAQVVSMPFYDTKKYGWKREA